VSAFYVLVSLAMGVIISATSASRRRGGAEERAAQHPARAAERLRLPDAKLPWAVQWIAEAFPATHYIRVARAIYIRGEGPLDLAPELGLLLLFGASLMMFALRRIEARA